MNWLNLEIKTLTSPEFLGSEPLDRATWLCLMRYCAQQENGGTIKDCEKWNDRKWQQLVGVTKEEVMRKSLLWRVKTDHIDVWAYPLEKEKEIQKNRKNGRMGGRPKNEANKNPEETGWLTQTKPSGSFSPKRKGKEEKGIKEKEILRISKKKENFTDDFSTAEFSTNIQAILEDWLDYKNRKYKPVGFKSLKTTLSEAIKRHGEKAVIAQITKAIANNWQGMNLDMLNENKSDEPDWVEINQMPNNGDGF